MAEVGKTMSEKVEIDRDVLETLTIEASIVYDSIKDRGWKSSRAGERLEECIKTSEEVIYNE